MQIKNSLHYTKKDLLLGKVSRFIKLSPGRNKANPIPKLISPLSHSTNLINGSPSDHKPSSYIKKKKCSNRIVSLLTRLLVFSRRVPHRLNMCRLDDAWVRLSKSRRALEFNCTKMKIAPLKQTSIS